MYLPDARPPDASRTDGSVKGFNGRAQREVLGITIHNRQDLETAPAGSNVARNARR